MKFLALLPPPAFCECRYWPRVSQRNRRFYAYLTALAQRISPFRHGAGVAFKWRARIGEAARGDTMGRVLNEILAYSCMAAFVTGIVVLAAATFIS
jgi:hypothetical protein